MGVHADHPWVDGLSVAQQVFDIRFGSKAEELELSKTSPLCSPTADIPADIELRRFPFPLPFPVSQSNITS